MIRAIRAVSSERGRDPARLHALSPSAGTARSSPPRWRGRSRCGGRRPAAARPLLGGRPAPAPTRAPLRRAAVLRPTAPPRRRRRSRRRGRAWRREARADSPRDGLARRGRATAARSPTLRYLGQSFELTVAVPDGPAGTGLARRARGGVRTRARADLRPPGRRRGPGRARQPAPGRAAGSPTGRAFPNGCDVDRTAGPARPAPRRPTSGREAGWLETPILRRADLPRRRTAGPLHRRGVRRDRLVPPDAHAGLDGSGNIVIAL